MHSPQAHAHDDMEEGEIAEDPVAGGKGGELLAELEDGEIQEEPVTAQSLPRAPSKSPCCTQPNPQQRGLQLKSNCSWVRFMLCVAFAWKASAMVATAGKENFSAGYGSLLPLPLLDDMDRKIANMNTATGKAGKQRARAPRR